jgi:L-iditol 2-dehydrogenase
MEKKMLAGAYNGTPDIELLNTDIPDIKPDEALLKIKAAGICGTDLRILGSGHARIPEGVKRILGHEFSGEIVKVGSEVSWPEVGTRICAAPNMGCGICDLCVQGNTQLCKDYYSFGVVINGGFAQYMKIPAGAIEQGNLSEIPENITYEEAAMVEPLSCALRGLMSTNPKLGETILIIGVGAIGLMFVQLAKNQGLKVIVSSRNDQRSELARKFGADLTFNPTKEDFHETILAATDGLGVDIAIVAAPSSEAQKNAIEVLAHHGRINFFGGLPKGNSITPIDANRVHYKEFTITGTTGSSVKQYRTSLKLVENGLVKVDSLITHKFPIEEVKDAIESVRSKNGLKTILVPN